MEKADKSYGLFTSLAMIIGIVIGSGIFFKVDNILNYTNGNVGLGVILFVLAALSIIFGSLSIAQLAKLNDKPGGIVSYANDFVGKDFATMLGWFQTFLYYPTLVAVVSWVVGIYVTLLFGIQNPTLELQMGIGILWLAICYLINIFSSKIGGKLQEISTIIKLIPLFVLGILAFVYSNPTTNGVGLNNVATNNSLSWLLAVGPIAFAFDGWIIATSVGHKIKNSTRNLPLALTIAPIFILIAYLIYFVGICNFLGPNKVMQLGDASVNQVAQGIFGENVAKAFLIFVVVSVMGTLNGLVMGFIQLPYSLAIHGLLPMKNSLSKMNKNYNMPLNSAKLSILISIFWLIVHYITTKNPNILEGMDISEISIVISYLLYMVLYYQVFKLWKKGVIKNSFFGLISPILASIGSIFILFGGLQNKAFLIYCIPICMVVLLGGYFYSKKNLDYKK